jgi:glycosyltransferase involved in cell wall biosynthesis
MKILLLTDMPPCRRYTAGLVLEQLVRFLPKEDIAICAVIDPALISNVDIPPDLEDIPMLILKKPAESFFKMFLFTFLRRIKNLFKEKSIDLVKALVKILFKKKTIAFVKNLLKKKSLAEDQPENQPVDLNSIEPAKSIFQTMLEKFVGSVKFLFELIQGFRVQNHLLSKIKRFSKEQHIDKLWVILEGQTMIRLARPLATSLNVPLFTQVWDPFEWWLRVNKVDEHTKKRFLIEYDNAIRHSTACATASWAMSEAYLKKYGVKNLPITACLPKEYAKKAISSVGNDNQPFIIGMAGQFYALDAWQTFVAALAQANWRVAGKNIFIRAVGGYSKRLTSVPKHFEDLGWKSQEETLSILANTDLLYMPYWFCDEFHLESSHSFPSKLVSYFCAGRPVFCHAPLYASPTKYILNKEAGYLCSSLDANVILETLERVILDKETYQRMAARGKECFLEDFTLERMQTTFHQFLNLHQSEL